MKKLFFILICFFVDFLKKSKIVGHQLCNSSLMTNQFKQSLAVGSLDLTTNPNPSVMSVLYDPTNVITSTLLPGEGVILVDLGANDAVGLPIVDKRAAAANAIEGVVLLDQKKAEKLPGDVITIAKKGAVVVMEASAAILRGAKVALVLGTPGQVVTMTTEALLGKALDKASSVGDLLRVEILAEGVV